MEITRRDDIGADLKAPSAARGGVATASYVLVPLVQPGDVVVHYGSRQEAIVGVSSLAVSCQAVEPPVHRPLQATSRQVEQNRGRQRGGGHGHRRVEAEYLGGQQDQSRIRHRQQSGYQRVPHIVQTTAGPFRERYGSAPSPSTGPPITSWARGDHRHVTPPRQAPWQRAAAAQVSAWPRRRQLHSRAWYWRRRRQRDQDQTPSGSGERAWTRLISRRRISGNV